jgi:hypothetical protein
MNPAFGNTPSKVQRYQDFWKRTAAQRPLTGFTLRGWFPLEEYPATRRWQSDSELTAAKIDPGDFIEEEERLLWEGERFDDDIIRGVTPASGIIPWLEAILGARLRILPGSVLAVEKCLSWDALADMRLDPASEWYRKYMQFASALAEHSRLRYPVSHSSLSGPADLMGAFRGHSQSILDLLEEPERSLQTLWRFGAIFKEITESTWKTLPLFLGGYFDGMYQLWAPAPIIRMQEDATGLYSPDLYRRFLQPIDRMLASAFPNAFIHLHSTSMFILNLFLEIEELRCFEINNDVSGPPVPEMMPHFRRVQQAKRSLIIRGSFEPDELRLLRDQLDPNGLMLLILVKDLREADTLRPIIGI